MEWWQIMAFAVLVDYAYFKLTYSRPGGPPVYYGLPFIGFAFIRLLPRIVSKKFRDVYLRTAPDVLITRSPFISVVLKHDVIRDVQQNPDCLPRPRLNYTDIVSWLATGTRNWSFFDGVRTSETDQWQTSRKIGIAAVYAGPKSRMAAKMSDAAEVFLKEIDENEGQKWNPAHSLMISKFQEVMHLFFGTTLKAEDINDYANYFLMSSHLFDAVITVFKILPFALFPVFKAALSPFINLNTWKDVYKGVIKKLYQDVSAAHSDTDSRDYFTAIASGRKNHSDLFYYLREITFTSFHVATHTTWHTILSVLSLMAIHQDVQKRVCEEIEEKIGRNEITPDSLDELSYLKAVISEALRLYPAVGLPLRITKCSTIVGGYRIPKGMILTPVLYSENYNSTHFPDPEVFDPNRHIDAKGNYFNDPNLGTFSRGKRACPGKNFVYLSASIYFVKILQRFSIETASNNISLGEFQAEFFPAAGKLDCLRFKRKTGAPSIRDVQLNTKLSQIVREVFAKEDVDNC